MDIERISIKLLNYFNVSSKVDELDYLKCKLGLEVLLINLSKILIIYGLALILGILKETLMMHIPYMVLRNSAFGIHSLSDKKCTLYSILLFVGIPWFVKQTIQLSVQYLFIIQIAILVLLFLYAPGDSSKYKVEEKRKKKLKWESLLLAGLMGGILLLPVDLVHKNLVILGLVIETSMILPFIQKINFKGGQR